MGVTLALYLIRIMKSSRGSLLLRMLLCLLSNSETFPAQRSVPALTEKNVLPNCEDSVCLILIDLSNLPSSAHAIHVTCERSFAVLTHRVEFFHY